MSRISNLDIELQELMSQDRWYYVYTGESYAIFTHGVKYESLGLRETPHGIDVSLKTNQGKYEWCNALFVCRHFAMSQDRKDLLRMLDNEASRGGKPLQRYMESF